MMRFVLAVLLGCILARPALALDGGRYGTVRLEKPQGTPVGMVILFSTGDAWGAPDQQAAEKLAGKGALVVGVDRAAYVAALDKASCYNLVGDADSLSKQLQRELHVQTYHAPVLAGLGQGGRLAQLALTEAPANTIAGAVSIDPQEAPGLNSPPCPRDRAASDHLLGFWAVGLTPDAPTDGEDWIAAEIQADRPPERQDFAAGTLEADMLVALLAPHLGQQVSRPEDVSDLPLVELPAVQPSNKLAIVLSGDGGWRDLDKSIAEELSHSGVQVVGWDSLRYFWSAKTPEQLAADLSRVMRVYGARWHATRIALIGYSFGADVLPFAYNRLPAEQRAQVSLMALLGFSPAADFEIRITGWLGMPPSGTALPTGPEIAKVPSSLVQCFYGEDEDDTACPSLVGTGADLVRTKGGHHFGGDYGALALRILNFWHRRIG